MEDLFNLIYVVDDPFATVVKLLIVLMALDIVAIVASGLGRMH